MYLPNFKFCTKISKTLCYKTQEGFTKVESSTWQQTPNRLKYCFYHICYPNLAFLISLKSKLQGAFAYQIPSFALKSIKNCGTKPERVYEISLRF
jgi:hypothetical protein